MQQKCHDALVHPNIDITPNFTGYLSKMNFSTSGCLILVETFIKTIMESSKLSAGELFLAYKRRLQRYNNCYAQLQQAIDHVEELEQAGDDLDNLV